MTHRAVFVDRGSLKATVRRPSGVSDYAGAGSDAPTVELPKNGHPLLDVRRPNVVLTPHGAWASDGATQFF